MRHPLRSHYSWMCILECKGIPNIIIPNIPSENKLFFFNGIRNYLQNILIII